MEAAKLGGWFYFGKLLLELRFQPRNPRYSQITVLAHNQLKMGLRVRKTAQNGQTWSMVRSMPGVPWFKNVRLGLHLSSKVDSTQWVGTARGFGTVLIDFLPLLAYFDSLSAHTRPKKMFQSSAGKTVECTVEGPRVKLPPSW